MPNAPYVWTDTPPIPIPNVGHISWEPRYGQIYEYTGVFGGPPTGPYVTPSQIAIDKDGNVRIERPEDV